MMMPINRAATAMAILALVPAIFHQAPLGYPGVYGLIKLFLNIGFFLFVSWRLFVALQYDEK